MPYIANTDQDRADMLAALGWRDLDAMWQAVGITDPPPALAHIPAGRSEYEVTRHLANLADRNAHHLISFLGSGYYDHHIPAAVAEITGRGEFYTAYTPYQPEASQGTLQAMYEFQSAICRLTGMEVSNASHYDGGTALFEAIMMALRLTRRNRVLMSGTVSPIYREMIRCYTQNLAIQLETVPAPEDGTCSDMARLTSLLTDDTACLLVQYPNVFGTPEDWAPVIAAAQARGIVTVCSTYPVALSLLRPPGEFGFDIVTGEGQSLGIPLSFGGPYLGFITTRMKHVRQLPGRLVGRTVDAQGRDGFVLTLQAREQHIRREKATSNICTNEALCALAAIAYLTCLGRQGFRQLGQLCAAKAVFAREQLLAIPGVTAVDQPAFFNEFVIRLPVEATDIVGRLIDKGFAAGFPLARYYPRRKYDLLVAVTEKRSREEIRRLAVALEAALTDAGHPCHQAPSHA
jgi:glycine dehydrogenase subunit 1